MSVGKRTRTHFHRFLLLDIDLFDLYYRYYTDPLDRSGMLWYALMMFKSENWADMF